MRSLKSMILVAVLLLGSCSTDLPLRDRASPSYGQACRAQGGVLYKGPFDTDYTCVDREAVQGTLQYKTERVHLPTKCKEFYNDGTGRWIECMGVGYK